MNTLSLSRYVIALSLSMIKRRGTRGVFGGECDRGDPPFPKHEHSLRITD